MSASVRRDNTFRRNARRHRASQQQSGRSTKSQNLKNFIELNNFSPEGEDQERYAQDRSKQYVREDKNFWIKLPCIIQIICITDTNDTNNIGTTRIQMIRYDWIPNLGRGFDSLSDQIVNWLTG